MKKKNILFLIETSGPGGAENMLLRLASSLDDGFIPSVCLLRDGWLREKLKYHHIPTVIIPQRFCLDYKFLIRLKKYIKENKISLLHSHEFAMNVNCSFLSLITRIPCVTTIHGKNYYGDKWYRKLAYRFASRHSHMVAVSDDLKNYLNNTILVKEDSIYVIENGVSDYSYTESEQIDSRKKIGVIDSRPVIGTVGNLYPVKGYTYLLESARIVCNSFPNALFIIIGRGHLENNLNKQIEELELLNNVRLMGFREDIASLLSAMDIYVMSSLSEGMPLSILEAMSASKPIVSTNVGGISEVINNGKTGILVNAKDSVGMAESLIMLLQNQEIADEYGRNAKKVIVEKFDHEVMLKNYQKIYGELMK